MSLGDKKTTTTKSASTSSNKLDPAQMSLIMGNYNQALDTINRPYQSYSGERVAAPAEATRNAQDMIMSGAPQAGAGSMQAAIDAATHAANYRPLSIAGSWQPAAATTAAATSAPELSIPATRSMVPSAMGFTPAATSFAAKAPTLSPAPKVTVPKFASVAVAPASTATATPMSAAAIRRGDIRDVTTQTGLGGIASYMNPYEDQVVARTLADLDRSRQIAQLQNNEAADAARAFGGSRHGVLGAETNRAFDDTRAHTVAELRRAGFDDAAGRLMSDRDRLLQAAAANQGADLSVAGQNAGFRQQAGLTNAQLGTEISRHNAAARDEMARFAAGLASERDLARAGLESEIGKFNAASAADLDKYAAGLLADIAKFNAASDTDVSRFNTGLGFEAAARDQEAANRAAEFNAAAENEMTRFGTGLLADTQRFNAASATETNRFNANAANNMALANQEALLRSLLADQAADQSAADLSYRSAGLLGSLSDAELEQLLARAGALGAVGAQQQAQEQAELDDAYRRWLEEWMYPLQQQDLRNAALGLLPLQWTTTGTNSGTTKEKTNPGLLTTAATIGGLFR